MAKRIAKKSLDEIIRQFKRDVEEVAEQNQRYKKTPSCPYLLKLDEYSKRPNALNHQQQSHVASCAYCSKMVSTFKEIRIEEKEKLEKDIKLFLREDSGVWDKTIMSGRDSLQIERTLELLYGRTVQEIYRQAVRICPVSEEEKEQRVTTVKKLYLLNEDVILSYLRHKGISCGPSTIKAVNSVLGINFLPPLPQTKSDKKFYSH